ncbi:MAG: hypothetical protein MJK04_16850, partial [Psychrosphaera sp.]|nr:hypothetical protein [Psychrosphaera sp.]
GAKIHHDWLIKGLGLVCLLFAVVLLYVFLTESYQVDKPGETTALIGLLTVLGLFAFLFVLEGFFVKGFCNKSTVHFMTPWTGTKDEKWQDIESVKFNVWCQWLVITFRSGKIIRLTPYLQGWKFALDVLKERGHDF